MRGGGLACCRGIRRVPLIVATAVCVLGAPAVASAVVDLGLGGAQALPDVDTRPAVEPTDAQRDAARATGAQIQWGRSGTPSSVFSASGPLATVPGDDAAAAARAWLAANRTLFRLASLDALDVLSAGPLVGSDSSYAVVLRQKIGGLTTTDGVVSIGLRRRDAGWDVTY